MFKVIKNFKCNLVLLVLIMGGLSAHSFASQNMDADQDVDGTYLGGIIKNWQPLDSKSVYVFYMNDVMGWDTFDQHAYHVNARQKLPDFWTVTFQDKGSKSISVIYPDWEKLFLNLWQRGQSVILWYCYNEEVIHKYLEASLAAYSSPERIKGHIQSLINQNALAAFGGGYLGAIQNLVAGRSPILIGNWTPRAKIYSPILGVQPRLQESVGRVCQWKNQEANDPAILAEQVQIAKTLCRQQVACVMGMIDAIEALPDLSSKKEKLSHVLYLDEKFDGKWQPPYLDYKAPMVFHPKTQEWVETGEKILNAVAQFELRTPQPTKAYGTPDYERQKALRIVRKKLNDPAPKALAKNVSLEMQNYMPDTQTLLRLVSEAQTDQLGAVTFQNVEGIVIDRNFMGLLKHLKEIHFRAISINPDRVGVFWEWLTTGDGPKTLFFEKIIDLTVTNDGVVQTMPMSVRSMGVHGQHFTLNGLGAGAWQSYLEEKKIRSTEGEELFIDTIYDHILKTQESRGFFKALTMQRSGVNMPFMLKLARLMDLERLDFSNMYRSQTDESEPIVDLLDFLDGANNIKHLNIDFTNLKQLEIFKLFAKLEHKSLKSLAVGIKTSGLKTSVLRRIALQYVIFLGNNDRLQDVRGVSLGNAIVEDFESINFAYNKALYKLRREKLKTGEVSAETLRAYEYRLNSLPKFHMKLAPNVAEVYGLTNPRDIDAKIDALREAQGYMFYLASEDEPQRMFGL